MDWALPESVNGIMNKLFLLLFIYQVKHFLADYPLQGAYMLGKFKLKGWVAPLASHAFVHAGFTVLISIAFLGLTVGQQFIPIPLGNGVSAGIGYPLVLGAFDFIMHFTMDRIKASPNLLGRFKDMYDRKFWWCLGFDQMFHHLTHYTIIYVLWRLVS
jgi:hypothetical protein